MASSLIQPTELTFLPDFSQKHYELFEVDSALVDEILNGTQQLQIKSYTMPQSLNNTRTAALCSLSSTYKLKKSETSNTFFVTTLPNGQILKQTSITIDLEKSQTNKYQVAKLILQYPLISIKDDENDQHIESSSVSRDQILRECQISEGELDQLLKGDEKFDFFIVEIRENLYSFFDPVQLYQLIDSILIFIGQQQDQSEIDAENILFNHDGLINERFLGDIKIIEYALNYIGNKIVGSDSFKLDKQKVTKAISLALLYVKGDYYLGEYIASLKKALELAMPQSLIDTSLDVKMTDDQQPNDDISQNLFEYYSAFDLSYLKGSAIIIPSEQLRITQRQDDVIRLLHPYYSMEFSFNGGSADKRLEALFEIKEKWTQQELSQYLKRFIDLGVNFDNYLMKNTKIVKDKNPFNSLKDIAYYMKKF